MEKTLPRQSERMANLTVAILQRIKQHTKENPILSSKLEEEFSVPGATVRNCRRILQRQGELIASTGGETDGYYYAKNYDEMKDTLQDMWNREISLRNTRLSILRKLGLGNSLMAQ